MTVDRLGASGHGPTAAGARRVVFVAFPDLQVLDLTGPHEVFSVANRLVAHRAERSGAGAPATLPYDVEVVARHVDDGGAPAVTTSSGLRIAVDRRVDPDGATGPEDAGIDTLVVVGGIGTSAAVEDRALLDWTTAVAPGCRRVTSVCTGAFVLAAAGLLDGRRATTHWASCDRLQEQFPAVEVEADPIFVRDGNVTTSAGVTAGIDLALALVEDDLGSEVALQVARMLVVFVQRPGGQSQFSAQLALQSAERGPLRDLQVWMVDNPDADLSVAALAERVGMSPRHLARVFRAELGTTPAQYVETVRVETVRRLLETSDGSLHQLARQAGFGTVETLVRAFQRRMGTTPGQYRYRFTRPRSPA
jgi:transcriptional regulator GlxA family with amidase domain